MIKALATAPLKNPSTIRDFQEDARADAGPAVDAGSADACPADNGADAITMSFTRNKAGVSPSAFLTRPSKFSKVTGNKDTTDTGGDVIVSVIVNELFFSREFFFLSFPLSRKKTQFVTPSLYPPMTDANTVAAVADYAVSAQPKSLYFLKAALRTMTAERVQNHVAHATGFVLALSATLLVLRLLP
jgi:hypothetical protein